MAYVNNHEIETAAIFLMEKMANIDSVNFSDFYDEAEIKRDEAERESGLGDETLCLLEFAITQLEENGVVDKTQLDSLLPDGENDYTVAWTTKGRELGRSSETMRFRDLYV